MRLICPSCGAVHSAEAWRNDDTARACMVQAVKLPGPVSAQLWGYLALFRPGTKRGLQWSRVQRLMADLADQVGTGHIQQARKVARPASPAIWAQAMEKMIDQPPGKLPLKNHNYLRAIVYDLADEADRKTETARNQTERTGQFRGESTSRDASQISVEEMRAMVAKKRKNK